MTRSFSIPLAAHLRLAKTTLTTCIELTRRDGNVYGFSMHDRALVFDGLTYEPTASFVPSDIAANSNMDLDNLSVTTLIDSETISEEDVRARKWDFAAYRIFQVNWADLSMGDKKDSAGHLGEISSGRLTLQAELIGLLEAYTITIGIVSTPGCRTDFGSPECGVSLVSGSPALTVSGTITTDSGDFYRIFDSSRTEADDFFTEGVITFLDGPASGYGYEVKLYLQAGGEIVTKVHLPANVAGSSYSMHAGCLKRFTEDCVGRYSNGANFRGEPHRRGSDVLVQVGRHGD